jgi:DNA (cytosine-5)-methyltransferase 1
MKTLKLIDLFCGTGGFAHGFSSTACQYELLYAIDADPHAVATTAANHPTSRVDLEDIRHVAAKALKAELGAPDVDLIVGGPPCQGFSSLRPHRSTNTDDARNNLFVQYGAFVDEFRPTMFVLENVVGIATHDEGRTLSGVIEHFEGLGYALDWRILNAAHFGVPQKRERFILIGSRDNGPIKFPSPTHYSNGKVIGHMDRERLQRPSPDLPNALTVNDAISDLPSLSRGEHAITYDKPPETEFQRERRSATSALSLHEASRHSDKMLEVIKRAGANINSLPPGMVTSGFSSCYSRLPGDEPSNTITVKFQSPASSRCIHPTQDRTITPREAARIQSFDDDYVFCGPMTNIAAQLGNAVPPLLGRAISSAISPQLA